jgi:hypothetical protein
MMVTDAQREERLWARVEPDGICWRWTGDTTKSGYAVVTWKGKIWRVHRLIWEKLVGPCPEGLEPDHLCRVRHCVNPDCIEWVTPEENKRRMHVARGTQTWNGAKTHCPQDHEYTPENTGRDKKNRRYCKTCNREKANKRRISWTYEEWEAKKAKDRAYYYAKVAARADEIDKAGTP